MKVHESPVMKLQALVKAQEEKMEDNELKRPDSSSA